MTLYRNNHQTMLLDIHTHRLPSSASSAILSCSMWNTPIPNETVFLSAGIHPWYVSEADYKDQLEWVRTMAATDIRTIAIGEAGLDKLCQTPFELQLNVFREIISIAEHYRLPLILHAVKTTNELIAFKKEYCPHNAWIIHGFRGKRELAQSLVRQGFYLSFGSKYNHEALQSIPNDRILIETDEDEQSVHSLYQEAASLLHTAEEELKDRVQTTINQLFFSR